MAPLSDKELTEVRSQLNDIKELITQLRICIAKMDANQQSFKDSLNVFREERLKTYDIMTKKIEEVEADVHKLDKKITYAAGIGTAAATFLSYAMSTVTKKMGLV
jgi:chromosome segregation ATPase